MRYFVLFFLAFVCLSCSNNQDKQPFSINNKSNFKPETYELRDNSVRLVRGQVLYMPVYSNMPQYIDSQKFDMSAFVAVHNTDFNYKIRLQKVQYFDTKGKLVYDFLNGTIKELSPLESIDFYIPHSDQSGSGANFLIEWKSDSLVTEPLVESITMNLTGLNTIGVLSQGKVIKEIR
ncbi:MAG: DUF3124 domain-containing protein [Bacteroidales bacterium]|nr:DUF3124 domain-containing protein [Bacteroidales bacterium]